MFGLSSCMQPPSGSMVSHLPLQQTIQPLCMHHLLFCSGPIPALSAQPGKQGPRARRAPVAEAAEALARREDAAELVALGQRALNVAGNALVVAAVGVHVGQVAHALAAHVVDAPAPLDALGQVAALLQQRQRARQACRVQDLVLSSTGSLAGSHRQALRARVDGTL